MEPFHIAPESFNPDTIDFGNTTMLEDPDYERRQHDLQPEAPKETRQTVRRQAKPRVKADTQKSTSRKAEPSAPASQSQSRTLSVKPAAFSSFFSDGRFRIFAGIVLALVTVYLLAVTISYFNTVAHDQSLTGNNTWESLVAKTGSVKNLGGPLGAWVSDMLITRWLGVGVFVLILYMTLVSLSLLKVRSINFWSLTFRSLLTIIALSTVVGLATWEFESPIMWGGAHGHFLNEKMIEIGRLPAAIGLSLIMIAAVTVVFLNDLKHVYGIFSEKMAERAARNAERRELRRQEEARKEAARTARKEAERTAVMSAGTDDKKSVSNNNQDTDNIVVGTIDNQKENKSDPDTSSDENDNEAEIDMVPTIGDMTVESKDIEQADVLKIPEPVIAIGDSAYDPRADLSRYQFPTLEILHEPKQRTAATIDAEEQAENQQRITKTLLDYGIPISDIRATVGPTVTLYEIVPVEGVRIAKIKRLEDDIAMSLAALGIRIIAPIPGKSAIGIEVPNKDPQTVPIRSILGSKAFQDCKMELPMAMGSTISNEVFIADLTKMPHLLVAGATGMGKSVGLNTIIASLLYKKHPAELKFVLVDPKMVEFSLYARLERHYLAKLPGEDDAIITDPAKVVATLNSLCLEMDNRYTLLKDAGCRNLKEYNEKFVTRHLNPERGHRFLPYIVVVVDEFADLIMTAGKEVETPIARIAQKARAVGIHMILATQRPSTNVITGVIKANFPGRIAFRVFQMVDSRTILDRPGANQLIGRGDMLFSNNGKIDRVQCAFIDTDEVESIVKYIDEQMGYDTAYELPEFIPDDVDASGMGSVNDHDSLFEEAARFVVQSSTASTSSLQRRYSIGYNRAGKIMDQFEAAGIVGPTNGGKPRQVLMDPMQLERLLEIAN